MEQKFNNVPVCSVWIATSTQQDPLDVTIQREQKPGRYFIRIPMWEPGLTMDDILSVN